MRMDQVIAAAVRFGRGASGDAIVAWKGGEAYVLSYDRTVLLRVQGIVPRQPGEVVFRACDYEGPLARDDGAGTIEFQIEGGVVRVPKPQGWTFGGMEAWFERLKPGEAGPSVVLDRSVLSVLDDSLPHVEFVWDADGLHLIQRDIYTGKTLEMLAKPHKAGEAEPLAMRTGDFTALFSLSKALLFTSGAPVFLVSDERAVTALVGGCLYDDLGILKVAGGEGDRR